MVSLTFLPRLASNHDPPISDSQVTGITGVSYQALLAKYGFLQFVTVGINF
jgi:hypothetical protein